MTDSQLGRDAPIREFLTGLASANSAQGVVSAAAVAGAMGTSLLLRVAALPTTRSDSLDDRTALLSAATALGDVQAQLIETIETETAVSRPAAARAQTERAAIGHKHARCRRRVCYEGRDGRLHVMPASVHGRRPLPPVGTSAWGRSMLAKQGGLARQRQCRALGINPTAEATARRLELRRINQRHPR
jgi:formiminotransferase-cyclodeaminase